MENCQAVFRGGGLYFQPVNCVTTKPELTHVSVSLSFFRKPRAFLVRFFSPSPERERERERENNIMKN